MTKNTGELVSKNFFTSNRAAMLCSLTLVAEFLSIALSQLEAQGVLRVKRHAFLTTRKVREPLRPLTCHDYRPPEPGCPELSR